MSRLLSTLVVAFAVLNSSSASFLSTIDEFRKVDSNKSHKRNGEVLGAMPSQEEFSADLGGDLDCEEIERRCQCSGGGGGGGGGGVKGEEQEPPERRPPRPQPRPVVQHKSHGFDDRGDYDDFAAPPERPDVGGPVAEGAPRQLDFDGPSPADYPERDPYFNSRQRTNRP